MPYPEIYSTMMNNVTTPQGYAEAMAQNEADAIQQRQNDQRRSELEAEYSSNQAKIAELKQKLKTLESDNSLDRIDRQLAQNRARIGDIGMSRAHQGDINSRRSTRMQWRWQDARDERAKKIDKAKADAKRIRDLQGAIADLDIMMPSMDRSSRFQAQNKRRMLVEELEELGGSFTSPDYNVDKSSWGKDEWEAFKEDRTDSKGYWLNESDRDEYVAAMAALGTAEGAGKAKKPGKTKEQIQREKEAYEQEGREADTLASKYFGKIDMAFKNRWNNAVPDSEIKKLKKFYDLKDGFLVKKERK